MFVTERTDVTVAAAEEGTRERVLAAASRLFATRGYAGTTIAAIRDASGVMPSSIYWEFENKEGLLFAVLDEAAECWLEQIGDPVRRAMEEGGATPARRLTVALSRLADAAAEQPEFHRLLLVLGLESRTGNEPVLAIVRKVRDRAIRGFSHLFVNAGVVSPTAPPDFLDRLARAALAVFDGALAAAQIDPTTADIGGTFALLAEGVLAATSIDRTEGGERP